VGEVRAGAVGVHARRSLWGRGLISFTCALGTDTSQERGRGLLAVDLTGSAGRTSVRRSGSAVGSSSSSRARRIRGSSARGSGAGSSATAVLITVTAIAVSRGIGVDEAAAFAIGTRAREPERAADLRLVLKPSNS